ncbi:MAG: hypothetical protein U9R56_01900 [candidate division Zixibacteria bacterium]|nr:hypothetical protein [candidate division Zixibacteria bacterium]
MRKAICATITIGLLAIASVALGSSRLTNVELSYQDGHTVACIDVAGTVRYTHQTEVAKDGKPFRVIVDILAATHNLGAREFHTLPSCPVQAIRSSQYSVKPEKVTRVVFDMDRETMYRIDSDAESIRIHFQDKSGRQFPNWSTKVYLASKAKTKTPTTVVTGPNITVDPLVTAPDSREKKTPAEVNAAISKDRLASLQEEETVTASSVESGDIDSKRSKRQETVSGKPEQQLAESPVTPHFSEKDKWAVLYESPQKPTIPATKAITSQAKPASSVKKEVSKPKNVHGESAGKPQLAAGKAVSSTSTQPESGTQKSSPILASVDEPVVSNISIVNDKQEVPTQKKKSAASVQKSNKNTKNVAKQIKSDTVSKDTQKTPAAKEVAPVPAEEKVEPKKKSTSRFRRRPDVSKKIKGTLVAEFPKRLVIKYKSSSRRDPFETLINDARILSNPVQQRVPNVEGLKLVGTIESESGSSALFEDTDGYSYILKAGDKVRKGYVLRVESDRVYFQIFEYGWSRTMALNIED